MNTIVKLQEISQKQDEVLALMKNLCKNKGEVSENKVFYMDDLMRIFRVSRRTLFTWKSKGKLTFGQIGKKLYVTQQELERFINNLNKGD